MPSKEQSQDAVVPHTTSPDQGNSDIDICLCHMTYKDAATPFDCLLDFVGQEQKLENKGVKSDLVSDVPTVSEHTTKLETG